MKITIQNNTTTPPRTLAIISLDETTGELTADSNLGRRLLTRPAGIGGDKVSPDDDPSLFLQALHAQYGRGSIVSAELEDATNEERET